MNQYDWMDIESEENLKENYKLKEIVNKIDEDQLLYRFLFIGLMMS